MCGALGRLFHLKTDGSVWPVLSRMLALCNSLLQYRQLTRYRRHRPFLRVRSSSRRELCPPVPQITVFSKRSQNVVRPRHQQVPRYSSPSLLGMCGSLSPVLPPRLQLHKTSGVAKMFAALFQPISCCEVLGVLFYRLKATRFRHPPLSAGQIARLVRKFPRLSLPIDRFLFGVTLSRTAQHCTTIRLAWRRCHPPSPQKQLRPPPRPLPQSAPLSPLCTRPPSSSAPFSFSTFNSSLANTSCPGLAAARLFGTPVSSSSRFFCCSAISTLISLRNFSGRSRKPVCTCSCCWRLWRC